jgi:transcriptional regulator with XRE-family HTH domain
MNTVEIGRYIKELLKEKGYTQEKLADHLGISKQAVSQNLSGRSSFDTSNLMLIAEFLDVTLDDLLYAGSKKDTLLSKFYKKNHKDIKEEDVPEQPDSLNKTLLDYCIDDNNIDKFNFFYEKKLIIDSLHDNINFIAFLIRNKQSDLLQSHFRTPIKNTEGSIVNYTSRQIKFPDLSEIENLVRSSRSTPLYANLTENQKTYVDSVLSCREESILKLIPFSNTKRNNNDLSVLGMIAIEKDNDYVIDYYIKRTNYRVKKYIFEIAINYKSYEVAKYLYDNYDLKSVDNLLKIDDREFIQNRLSSMKLNEYEMSQGIIKAVKVNDLLAVKSLINIVDKKSLHLALEHADFEKGLDIAKALLEAGAEFSVVNVYDSKNRIKMPSVTSAVKHLLGKLDKIKKN